MFDRKRKVGRKPVSKNFYQNDTKGELVQRIRRQNATISRLESMINAPVLKIKQALDKQYKKKDIHKKGVLELYCIIEALTFPVSLTKEQLLFCSSLVEKGYYKKVQIENEDGSVDYDFKEVEEEEGSVCYFVTQYNVVNVFLTKKEAEIHLSNYKKQYHKSATIKKMTPKDNEEFRVIYNLMLKIGEHVDESIYQDAELLVNVKKKLKDAEAERDNAKAEVIQISEEIKKLKEENQKLLGAIDIKKLNEKGKSKK